MSLIILLSVGVLGCVKWELDKAEIVNYDRKLVLTEGASLGERGDIVQTAQGNYIYVGSNPAQELLIVTLSEQGDIIQQQGDLTQAAGHAIIPSAGGVEDQFIVLASGEQNSFLLEIDEQGHLLQQDSLKEKINSEIGLLEQIGVYDIALLQDENYAITGFVKQTIGNKRLFLAKLNASDWSIAWIKTYNQGVIGTKVQQMQDSSLVILGHQGEQARVSVVTSEGVFKWQQGIVQSTLGQFSDLQVTEQNEILLLTTLKSGSTEQGAIITLDSTGTSLKQLPLDDLSVNRAYKIQFNRNKTLVIVGTSVNSFASEDIILAQLDPVTDSIEWLRNYDGTEHELPFSLLQVQDFGFLVSGTSRDSFGNDIFRLIKTDEEGLIR